MKMLKHGQKIKYSSHIEWGKEVIKTAYVLRDDGNDLIWISDTKEELNSHRGATILRSQVRR